MGIDPKSLSPHAQKLIQEAVRKHRVHGLAYSPLSPDEQRAPIWVELAMTPPTTPHPDKEIRPIGRKGGGHRMTLMDSKALRAVRTMYLAHMKPCPLPPMEGPVAITICFAWKQADNQPLCAWWEQKPDWDNAAKALCDTLVERGYLPDDKRIVDGRVMKALWRMPFVVARIAPALDPLAEVRRFLPAAEKQWANENL